MEKLFKLEENGTNVRTEIVAGITTFLAMAYILAVNPSILSAAGMDSQAIFAATAVSAAFATLIMAFFANYPVVLASGMGLNAYFAFTVVPNLAKDGITDPWKVALTAILCEGVIFIILSIFKFRETLVNKVPKNLKLGISAGIGLFIVIVGFKGAGIVTTDAFFNGSEVESSTLVKMGDIGSPQVVLALLGILIIAALWHFKVKGAILIGILLTWIFGIIAELFTGILAGGHTSPHVENGGMGDTSFGFAAIDYGIFGDKKEIRANMSTLLRELRESPTADGQERVYTPGEQAMLSQADRLANGIPVNDKTVDELKMIGEYVGLNFDDYIRDIRQI